MTIIAEPGAKAPSFLDSIAGEPSIDDILADPIVALILRRDGSTASVLRAQLAAERQRLAALRQPPALERAA